MPYVNLNIWFLCFLQFVEEGASQLTRHNFDKQSRLPFVLFLILFLLVLSTHL